MKNKYNKVAMKFLEILGINANKKDFIQLYIDFFNSQLNNYIEVINQ